MANNFMEEIYGEDYIEHHGVKGMKWGVRRQRNRAISARYNSSLDKTRQNLDRKVASGRFNSKEADRRYDNQWEQSVSAISRDKHRANAKAYSEAAREAKSSKKAAKYERKAAKQLKKAEAANKEVLRLKKMSDLTDKTYDTKISSGEKLALSIMGTDNANKYLVNRSKNSAAYSAGQIVMERYLYED